MDGAAIMRAMAEKEAHAKGRAEALAEVRAYLEAERDGWRRNHMGAQSLALHVVLRDCPLFRSVPGTTEDR